MNSSQLEKDYKNNIIKAHSHRAKANTKAKKIKEQSEAIIEKISNIKENFRFPVWFRLVWMNMVHIFVFVYLRW